MNFSLINNWFSRRRAVWLSLFLFYIWLSSKGSGFPEPAEIVVTILAALTILVRLHTGGGKGLPSFFSLLLFVYVIYFAALLLIAPMPEYGLDKVLGAISIFFLYLFFTLTIRDREQNRALESALIFAVLFLSFFELLFILPWYADWLAISGSVFTLPPVSYRLDGIILAGANFTSAFLNLILPFVVIRFITADTSRRKRLWIGCLLFIGVIEFFASSRGGWFAALGAGAVTLFLYYQPALAQTIHKIRTQRSISLGWGTGAKLFGMLLLATFVALLFSLQVQVTPGHAGVLSGRETIWSNAWQIWSASFWTGQGPGTFPLFNAQLAGLPPGWLADHAHNLWLHLGAESGAIGVALAAVMTLVVGAALLSAWRRYRSEACVRAELSAYIGIGAGILLANLADFYFHISLYTIYCLILVAMALKYVQPRVIHLPKLASTFGLLLILLFYLGGSWFSISGIDEYTDGLLAHQEGDLHSAQTLACKAADLGPQFPIFSIQCGLSSANLFYLESAGPGLQEAKKRIELGLATDPSWPGYWASLAILEWKQAAHSQAIAYMQRAVTDAPHNALFAVNLGWMAEETKNMETAAEAYQQALAIDPWLIESPYFQATEFRASIVKAYSQSPLDSELPLVVLAYRALQADDLDAARDYLDIAREEDPRDPQVWAMLGLLALQERDSKAWFYAQTAVFLENTDPRVLTWAADVARSLGHDLEAARITEEAFYIWVSKLQYDTPQYYSAVYHRPSYGQNFVPGYVRADATPDMLASFNWLAEFYRSQDDFAQADLVQRWLALEGAELTDFSSSSDQ